MAMMAPVIRDPFSGILAVFLLDMGLLVGRRLREFATVGWPVVAFGVYMPLLGACIGLLAAHALGLSEGDVMLVSVLGASASYIVVPAATRLSLPQANPTIYVTLSLAVTFPFNLIVGIPLSHADAQAIAAPEAKHTMTQLWPKKKVEIVVEAARAGAIIEMADASAPKAIRWCPT